MSIPSRAPSPRLLVLASAIGAACATADDQHRRADREVEELLSVAGADLAERREAVVFPEAADPLAATVAQAPRSVLTLPMALAAAIDSGRDYLSRKEDLYLTALALSGTRHAYSPLISALLSAAFADGDEIDPAFTTGFAGGVTKVLPWGADLAAALSSNFIDTDGDGAFDTGASLRYTQPLLRGAGHAIAYEPLIQAERGLLYAIRDFERFRESYAIQVARGYYDLVEQKQSLENQRRSLERLTFARRHAEAKFQMGEVEEVEVLRARRSELSGQNDLIQAEEELELALERYRVFLGLGDEARIDVEPIAPEFVPVAYDVASAVEVMLSNRLDYLNERERLEDSERDLAIARDALRGSLDLALGYDVASDTEATFADQRPEGHTWRAGIVYDLPVDRLAERNAYRAAEISHTRNLRDFDEFEDNLVVDLRNRFRSLRRIEQSLEIQRESIHDEERNVVIAQLLFDRGENSNRDVVEAQESLLEAQNSLVREQVSYEIERLNLLRDMGILFIDERGMWAE